MAEYDPSTPVGIIRLLTSDVDTTDPFFSDAELQAFLDLEIGDIRTAAAQALDTIASNEALTAKVIKTLDLQTDGPALSADLRERAQSLRAQTRDIGEDFSFDAVQFVPNDFAARQAIFDERLREG